MIGVINVIVFFILLLPIAIILWTIVFFMARSIFDEN